MVYDTNVILFSCTVLLTYTWRLPHATEHPKLLHKPYVWNTENTQIYFQGIDSIVGFGIEVLISTYMAFVQWVRE